MKENTNKLTIISGIVIIVILIGAIGFFTKFKKSAPSNSSSDVSYNAAPKVIEDEVREVDVDGKPRTFLFHVPVAMKQTPAALVIALHKEGDNAQAMRDVSQLNKLSDEEGFFVAYANGTSSGKSFSWNATYCCGDAVKQKADEAAFVKKIYSELVRFFPVDTKKIYLLGYSNGGMVVYDLITQVSDIFAAGVSVSANMPAEYVTDLDTDAPFFPFMVIQGKKDDVFPFEGGVFQLNPEVSVLSFSKMQAALVKAADCQNQLPASGSAVVITEYMRCQNGNSLRFASISEGTHEWSNVPYESEQFTTKIAWDFLKKFNKEFDQQ